MIRCADFRFYDQQPGNRSFRRRPREHRAARDLRGIPKRYYERAVPANSVDDSTDKHDKRMLRVVSVS